MRGWVLAEWLKQVCLQALAYFRGLLVYRLEFAWDSMSITPRNNRDAVVQHRE